MGHGREVRVGAVNLSEMFHVGIVVRDLDAAQLRLTELLGVAWGPVMESEIQVRDRDGAARTVPNRMCYSTQAPYLELIQEVPGTPWVCNEHSNLHHIGFFSGALAAESGRLHEAACPLEIMDGSAPAAPAMWAYHRDPLGVRVELVSNDLRAMMEELMWRAPGD